jgi:outer membrane receptor protein involved in Fe transport
MKHILILLIFLSHSAVVFSQVDKVTVSGTIQDAQTQAKLPFVNVILKSAQDSTFVAGTVSDEKGLFSISSVSPGSYIVEVTYVGYSLKHLPLLVGRLSAFLDLGIIYIQESSTTLAEVVVEGKQDDVVGTLERKIFKIEDNISQSGGSLLQVMKNLPGVTVSEEGTVRLRGSDRVTVLVDGKQTALTGFGNQTSLDNIPASAIERIEVINNPSAKYDANGNAGIVNIIFKKEVNEGFNGKVGLALGAGALWVKRENYPTIRPQYQRTPKINPSISLNYRKKKTNIFLQADNLYTETLNKNEYTDRYYDNGDTVRQQLKRNRDTNIITGKAGFDYYPNGRNTFTASALLSRETIIDRGDQPFFNANLSERFRLWQFLEDEVLTATTVSASWQYKYLQPGRILSISANYSFNREDEKYFFTNTFPSYTGEDSFALIADQHVTDLKADYIHPLKQGRIEGGLKLRVREIPTDMKFYPGLNSQLDVDAAGYANYKEVIPIIYGNYVFENETFEAEAGLRVEHVDLYYKVDPNHNTYETDGYRYTQPFPNVRLAYKASADKTISFFFTRRVDRPDEVDIRIFPKYDDAEIIKVGNPALRPQFTNSFELGYKSGSDNGYLYAAVYHKRMESTITRIGSIQPGSSFIYNIFQNAGDGRTSGIEVILSRNLERWGTVNLNFNGYQNIIDAFTVVNKYPTENVFSAKRQEIFSGSIKLNGLFHLSKQTDIQLSSVYLAPDVVPQGKTYSRFSIDLGIKRTIQKDKGEIFFNATDIANTMRMKREVNGDGFRYRSSDYYETQVVRVGYNYKF